MFCNGKIGKHYSSRTARLLTIAINLRAQMTRSALLRHLCLFIQIDWNINVNYAYGDWHSSISSFETAIGCTTFLCFNKKKNIHNRTSSDAMNSLKAIYYNIAQINVLFWIGTYETLRNIRR